MTYETPGCAYCPSTIRACRQGEGDERGPGYYDAADTARHLAIDPWFGYNLEPPPSLGAACRAGVWVCRGATTTAAPAGLLMAVRGTWSAGAHTLAPGQGLWWSDEALTWPLSCPEPDAALLAVAIHPATP